MNDKLCLSYVLSHIFIRYFAGNLLFIANFVYKDKIQNKYKDAKHGRYDTNLFNKFRK